jgi:hypothetical protein
VALLVESISFALWSDVGFPAIATAKVDMQCMFIFGVRRIVFGLVPIHAITGGDIANWQRQAFFSASRTRSAVKG